MSDYNKSNGIGGLDLAVNVSAAGAVVGKSRGVATVGPVGAVFTITPQPGAIGGSTLDVLSADVRGAVPGVAEVAFVAPGGPIEVRTFSAAGAAVALDFNLSVKRKARGGRTSYGPAGNVVVSALVDVVDTVPVLVGPARGLATPAAFPAAAPAVVRTGTGVYTVNLDPGGIDPLNAIVTARPADTAPAPTDRIVVAEHLSDTVITVRAFDGGVAADSNFYLHVERIAAG
jgi:hypothetical protein